MQRPLWFQATALLLVSAVLAVLNNLRPDAAIDWVRDWPPYSQLAVKEVETPTPPEAEAQPETDPAATARETADLVTSNAGIADIGLERAYQIYQHARDYTFWIDARSADLYEQGHIAGARLVNFYEQNQYLPEIEAAIAELQPVALVVYCKGKDCTDSHFLAEDLQSLGYQNIFVYKDGFDDWLKAGYPIEGELAESEAAGGETPPTGEIDQAAAAAVADLVTSNAGIADIGLEQAHGIYQHARDYTFWIDARSADLYERGHIAGARLLNFYEQSQYLPGIEAAIAETQPVALVVYCKGKDCTDSHFLAEDLQSLGYQNIFVYKDGFDDWLKAGYPIEGELAEAETAAAGGAAPTPRQLPEEKPPGMYLEHIVRDMVPFVAGLLFAVFWARARDSKGWVAVAAAGVGLFFIYAAIPKILSPLLFAKNIWNYDIAPAAFINISALWLPMVELLAGAAVFTRSFRKGGGFLLGVLLLIFIVAVSFNVLRGHEFDCGCTAAEPFFPSLYFEGWNDKYTLLLRDVGLLAMAGLAFVGFRQRREAKA